MPFNPSTNQYEPDRPLTYMDLIMQGQAPPSRASEPVTLEPTGQFADINRQGAVGVTGGIEPSGNWTYGGPLPDPTRAGVPGMAHQYGGAGGDVLNANEAAFAAQRQTEDRRAIRQQAEDQKNREIDQQIEAMLRTGPYSSPGQQQFEDQKLQSLRTLKGVRQGNQAVDESKYQTDKATADKPAADSLANLLQVYQAGRQELTNASLAELAGIKTPPGGVPPSPDATKKVMDLKKEKQGMEIAGNEDIRKGQKAGRDTEKANIVNRGLKISQQVNQLKLRGDIPLPQLNQSLKEVNASLAANVKLQAMAEGPEEEAHFNNAKHQLMENQAYLIDAITKATGGSQVAPPPAAPQPKTMSNHFNDWSMGLLGEPQAPQPAQAQPQGQSAAKPGQPSIQPKPAGPPASNALRQAQSLIKKVESGGGNSADQRSYELLLQHAAQIQKERGIPGPAAAELAARSVYGDY